MLKYSDKARRRFLILIAILIIFLFYRYWFLENSFQKETVVSFLNSEKQELFVEGDIYVSKQDAYIFKIFNRYHKN